jgi:hypothetical protein
MKATDLLVQQHREVDQLFAKLEEADENEKADLAGELATALVGHSMIEKEIFSPALREAARDEKEVASAFEEHAVVEFELKRLTSVKPNDETFDTKVGVLKELVQHHVREEETVLLKQAQQSMEDEQLDELGVEMEDRYEEITARDFRPLLDQALGLRGRAPAAKKTARRAPAKKTARRAPAKKAATRPTKRAAPAKRSGRKTSQTRSSRSR